MFGGNTIIRNCQMAKHDMEQKRTTVLNRRMFLVGFKAFVVESSIHIRESISSDVKELKLGFDDVFVDVGSIAKVLVVGLLTCRDRIDDKYPMEVLLVQR
jgi:hypothetical protein